MVNSLVLIGRLEEIKEWGIIIKVPRNYKNDKGEYENDLVPVNICDSALTNVKEYCTKDCVIGIRGRIEMFPKIDKDDFQDGNEIRIIGEKITFLSNNKREEK